MRGRPPPPLLPRRQPINNKYVYPAGVLWVSVVLVLGLGLEAVLDVVLEVVLVLGVVLDVVLDVVLGSGGAPILFLFFLVVIVLHAACVCVLVWLPASLPLAGCGLCA